MKKTTPQDILGPEEQQMLLDYHDELVNHVL